MKHDKTKTTTIDASADSGEVVLFMPMVRTEFVNEVLEKYGTHGPMHNGIQSEMNNNRLIHQATWAQGISIGLMPHI